MAPRLCRVGLPCAVRPAGRSPDPCPSGHRRRWRNGGLLRIYAHRLAAAWSCAEPAWGQRIDVVLAHGSTRLAPIGVVRPQAVRRLEGIAHLAPTEGTNTLVARKRRDCATRTCADAAHRTTLYASPARRDAASARLGSLAALRKTGFPGRSIPSTSVDGSSDGSIVAVAQSSSDRHR